MFEALRARHLEELIARRVTAELLYDSRKLGWLATYERGERERRKARAARVARMLNQSVGLGAL